MTTETPSSFLGFPARDDRPAMVLLVDDQVMIGEALRRMLTGSPGIDFHYCSDPNKAIAVAKDVRPTVILQDLVMPGVSGLDLVRHYRQDPSTRDIPVIVLSTKEDPQIKSEAFSAGANDYLVKLPDKLELVARVRYHSRAYLSQLERDEAYEALRVSQQNLVKANLELQRLTKIDGLTGISNRRYLDEYLAMEWIRGARTGSPIGVVMIDVDEFKRYNDTYGHLAGDDVLKAVAGCIQRHCRQSIDLAARFGGEEFSMVLSEVSLDYLEDVGNRLCRSIEGLRLPHRASRVGDHVTASVGAALAIPPENSAPTLLLEAADKALYLSKTAGRNRATVMRDKVT
jgi:two-component system chemotaxis family response regulator WspR